MDWDDIRIFLALIRQGSIRSAAEVLAVDHSTVSRRIRALEQKLGVRLVERHSTGYATTLAGEEMLAAALELEEKMMALERRVLGQDARLTGELRVTMPAILATKLLMSDLTAFTTCYPDIELEVLVSCEPLNLTKREADVAIRIAHTPPDNLIARRLFRSTNAAYTSLDYWERHNIDEMTWIGWDDATPHPPWLKNTPFPHLPVRRRLNDPALQLEAVRAGMGVGWLQCFVADQDPSLRRLAPGAPTWGRWLWLLTHEDLRNTARVQAFISFMAKAISAHRALIEGNCPFYTPVAPKGYVVEKEGKSNGPAI